jgi:hypothetical protein
MPKKYLARILEARLVCSQYAGMDKTIYSRQSQAVREIIVELRKKAGLTQRELAKRLKREHSLIGRLDLGERRLDIIELFWVCKACGANPDTVARRMMRKLEETEPNT